MTCRARLVPGALSRLVALETVSRRNGWISRQYYSFPWYRTALGFLRGFLELKALESLDDAVTATA